ncbi:unnamed protein product [Anisakis simplex]|uniref:NAD(P)H-dependent oxidoreductase subunit E n=1 Tax=Anisakis simplex TaxID=6269 RepID=A0A0M3JL13_ANISI|nr:unnamed protein product [Anisakis simplex]
MLEGHYSQQIIDTLTKPTLTVAEIDKFTKDYIQMQQDKASYYLMKMFLVAPSHYLH